MHVTKVLSFLTFLLVGNSVIIAQTNQGNSETNKGKLLDLADQWRSEKIQRLKDGQSLLSDLQMESKTVSEKGVIAEYQGVDDEGRLLFYITDNLDAAKTLSTDKVWPAGGLGLNLNGGGMIVGEWDGGLVRTTHQELTGRAFQLDSTSSIEDHPTHVAGTMIASGFDPSAKGMAYAATLRAFDWNFDDAEMAAEAAGGLLISNHSYGSITGWRYNGSSTNWEWWGDTTLSGNEDYKFGQYNSQSQSWDLIARNAPNYLIVKSAGNDRGDAAAGRHFLPLHGVFSSTSRPDDGGTSGYDCISTYSGAKNILTIGAVNAIPGGYAGSSSVVMSSFSGWGPTDDGRIKPDLVANGVGVYSSLATSNSAYASWNGTSMAAPNAAGSLVLVQQAYSDKNSAYMKSATLKALAIHTADEAGSAAGPDYSFGWGLINIASAVLHINDSTGTKDITETNLTNGNTYSFNVSVNGLSPIKATICWTDVPGTPPSSILNNTTAMLVNDLDIRVIRDSDSTIFYPYILNPASPSSSASTGDNFRDNVEQIYLAAPSAGSYTVVVSHKGTLSGGSSQDFSLILDGGIAPAQPLVCNAIVTAPAFWDFDTLTNCSGTSGAACVIPSWYGWENDTSDDIDWTIDNGGTPSSSTGPSIDYTTGTSTGKYLYTEASTSGTGFPGKQAIIYSPCIDLDTMTNSELAFAYHMYGSTMGSLSVEVYNGFSWSQLWTSSGDSGDVWNTATVDLSLFDGDTIQLRFVGTTGSNYFSDMAIDAIEIREQLSCPGPYNFTTGTVTDTTAIVSWSSAASFWTISLNIKGGATTISPVTINFNSVLFSSLTPNTTYELYVQDSCGLNDTSAWFGPYEFTTTGPLTSPSPCGLNAVIPDNDCPNLVYLPIQVTTSGSQLGIDVILDEVRLIIDHTWVGDLQFSIASPNGDTVLLSNSNGGSGINYGDPSDLSCTDFTIFSMSGDTLITNGGAPFIGKYIPEEPFSNLYNGSDPNGIWKFIVCDGAGGDVGSLEYLEFVFAPACSDPLSISDTNVTDSTAIIGWTSSASNHRIRLDIQGGPTVIAPVTINFNPVLFSGLIPNTTYDFYVQDSCSNGLSNWVGPFSFTTTGPESNPTNCGLNEAIPDNNCPTLSEMRINVTTPYTQMGIDGELKEVKVLIAHTYDADLTFGIVAPTNDTVLLSSSNGSSGNNYGNPLDLTCAQVTSFMMSAATPISSGTAPFIGTFIPDGNLTDFNTGFDPNGEWKFIICDNAGADVGTVEFVELVFNCIPPTVSISNNASDSICAGDSTYIFSNTTGVAYQWYKDGSLIPGATSIGITVSDDGLYNVVVDSFAGCSDSAQFGRYIVVNNLPVVSITNTGASAFCDGVNTTLSVANSGSYQWYRNGQIQTGATNSSLSVGTTGDYNVFVTNNFGCSDSSSTASGITVFNLPNVGLTTTSSTTFCFRDSVLISSSILGSSYTWYKDGSAVAGASSNSYTATNAGNYNVVVQDANSCSDSASSGVAVVVNPLPIVSITAGGSTSFCEEDSVILTASASTSYQWWENGIPFPGATGQSFTVKSAGFYNVEVTDGNNCTDSAASSTTTSTNPLPVGSISPSDTAICQGDTAWLQMNPAFVSYNWIVNGNASGSGNNQSYPASSAGNYTVIMEDNNNCSDTATNDVVVTINDLPNVTLSAFEEECNTSPPFTLTGGAPSGGNYSGTGVSSGQFDPGLAGPGTHTISYSFSDINTCTDSAVQSILIKNCTGIDDKGSDGNVLIYPNPTSGIVNIEFDQNWTGEMTIQLFTIEGALVTTRNIQKIENNPRIIVNIDEQSNGIYFLHLTKGQEKWIQRIILEKNF